MMVSRMWVIEKSGSRRRVELVPLQGFGHTVVGLGRTSCITAGNNSRENFGKPQLIADSSNPHVS